DATSATNTSPKPPACSISSTAAAKRSLERASTYTLAPRAARSRAHALPIPLDPPVTTATAPANSFAIPPHPPAMRRASRPEACPSWRSPWKEKTAPETKKVKKISKHASSRTTIYFSAATDPCGARGMEGDHHRVSLGESRHRPRARLPRAGAAGGPRPGTRHPLLDRKRLDSKARQRIGRRVKTLKSRLIR